jgi:tetratricopeptide (TPR) repeat protein
MKKRHLIVQLSFILLAGILLIGFPSCKEKKTNPANASDLLLLKAKAAYCLQNRSDSGLFYVDSAFRIINILNLNDSVKIEWLKLKVGIHLAYGQNDSVYTTFTDARDKAMVQGNNTIQAFADLWLGQQYTDDGKYLIAGKYLKEGLSLNEKSGNRYQIARSYNLYGTLLSFTGNYQEAQKYLIKAARIFEKPENNESLSAVYINIATNYDAINDQGKALSYFKKALNISLQKHDTVNYISVLNNLGIHYCLSQPDSSAFYYTEALKIKPSPSITIEIISVKFNLANLYFNRKEFDNALLLYRQVMDVCTKKGIYSGKARAYNGMANIYEARNKDAEAMNYYRKAYRLADSTGETPVSMLFLGNIQYMQEKQRDYESALVSYKKITETKDSLLSLQKQIALHDLEMIYNKEKTDSENETLRSNILHQDKSVRTTRRILFLVLISMALLAILTWNIYKLYRQRDQAYNALIMKYREGASPLDPEVIVPDGNNPAFELVPEDSDPDYQRLIVYFETKKPYIESNLHVDKVARDLQIGRKLLSQLLLANTGMNFNTFVNSYRIAEALRLLAEPERRHYKIEAIAKEAGFGSKASFYAAFSQITGSRPSEYR